MKIEIKAIEKKDYKKAIRFAIEGMHFDWYLDSRLLLQAYGRYFWYLEMNRATQILAAYIDGTFAGVLLAEIEGEEKRHRAWTEQLYVGIVNIIQTTCFKIVDGLYEETIMAQREQCLKTVQPDGEILFLAADPDAKLKGIGSALLYALAEREKGKTIFLHTDDACTYQFYEHRGFQRVAEQDIVLEMPKGRVPLKCMVYSKIM